MITYCPFKLLKPVGHYFVHKDFMRNFQTRVRSHHSGISLLVQWLRLHTSNAEVQRMWVQSLVGKLRSHMACGTAKN